MPVQFVLLLFGLATAGVRSNRLGRAPISCWPDCCSASRSASCCSRVRRLAGARLPQGLRVADLVVIGITAAIGFTVSLFFATAAFPGERHWPKRRWGRLSFGAAPWRSWRRDC